VIFSFCCHSLSTQRILSGLEDIRHRPPPPRPFSWFRRPPTLLFCFPLYRVLVNPACHELVISTSPVQNGRRIDLFCFSPKLSNISPLFPLRPRTKIYFFFHTLRVISRLRVHHTFSLFKRCWDPCEHRQSVYPKTNDSPTIFFLQSLSLLRSRLRSS